MQKQWNMVRRGFGLSVSCMAALVFSARALAIFVQTFNVEPEPILNSVKPLLYVVALGVVAGLAMVLWGAWSALSRFDLR